ncbi:hypothetical protein CA54_24200 [Symmachiella macrocystis]|uniref:Uncharacterized protein n=1 Tax=Symmachiella macrocystis TaxID=2527985 RepID=A0A5C6BNJ3_9PLAN|nr:hypothetical protein [Symmachiella macrocystis]TWU13585.1 hypothetical protein CA54_24200 [Symmachiella macrocystis]
MDEIFPIQCRNCAEIIDVAANIDVVAPYECPLCGADIAISEAENFDLPCPAEVVIEEQSDNFLRFRVADSPRGSDSFYLGRLFLVIGLVFLGCVVLMHFIDFDFWPRYFDDPLFVLMYGLGFLGTGVLQMTQARSLELAGNHLTARYHVLGVTYFQKRTRSGLINSVHVVIPAITIWPVRIWQVVIADRPKTHGRFLIFTYNLDAARYVTHTIRRQLKTMGHKLQDG